MTSHSRLRSYKNDDYLCSKLYSFSLSVTLSGYCYRSRSSIPYYHFVSTFEVVTISLVTRTSDKDAISKVHDVAELVVVRSHEMTSRARVNKIHCQTPLCCPTAKWPASIAVGRKAPKRARRYARFRRRWRDDDARRHARQTIAPGIFDKCRVSSLGCSKEEGVSKESAQL